MTIVDQDGVRTLSPPGATPSRLDVQYRGTQTIAMNIGVIAGEVNVYAWMSSCVRTHRIHTSGVAPTSSQPSVRQRSGPRTQRRNADTASHVIGTNVAAKLRRPQKREAGRIRLAKKV